MPAYARATVLTVEDDPIVRADLRLILEDAGFDVCSEARDGVEAVENARLHRPDVILLDLGLPLLGGVEAAQLILGERSVPIVALTGRSNADGQRAVTDAGATDIVLKPFSERELVGKVRGALRGPGVWVESEDDRQRVMVEQLVRQNRSEGEIVRALRGASGQPFFSLPASSWLRRLFRRSR